MSSTSERTSHQSSVICECLELGDAHQQAGDIDLAHFNYRRALALSPYEPATLQRLARSLQLRGEHDTAVSVLERLVDLETETPDYQADLACCLLQAGRRREALVIAERGCEAAPKSAPLLLALGHVQEAHGHEPEARDCYERVIVLDRGNAVAHSRLGALAVGRDDFDTAEHHFLHALAADPNLTEARLGLARFQSAHDLTADALDNYLRVLELAPDHVLALTDLVTFLRDRKLPDYPEALAQAMVSAFHCPNIDAQDLSRPTAYYLRHRLGLDRNLGRDALSIENLDDLIQCPLWHLYLRRCINSDAQIERWIVYARHWLLLDVDPQEISATQLSLAASIGQQVLRNGYIYGVTEDEQMYLEVLSTDIDQCLEEGEGCSPQLFEMLCLEGMYRSPVTAERLANLRDGMASAPDSGLRQLLESATLLVESQQRTVDFVAAGRSVTGDGDLVRFWDRIPDTPAQSLRRILPDRCDDPNAIRSDALHVLVVTRGDNRSALLSACHYRGSRITSVDSNPRAVQHGASIAERDGITNIRFLCGNAVQLGRLDSRYQVIECPLTFDRESNPSLALERIVTCLVPGGFMKITLPSRRARRNLPTVRRRALQLGLEASDENVRQFRARLVQGLEPSLVELLLYDDFYELALCRELLFPEHSNLFSPADIRDFAGAQDLEFLGFELPDRRLRLLFADNFPESDPLDLGSWERFEDLVPSAFKDGMTFWCRKRGPLSC